MMVTQVYAYGFMYTDDNDGNDGWLNTVHGHTTVKIKTDKSRESALNLTNDILDALARDRGYKRESLILTFLTLLGEYDEN